MDPDDPRPRGIFQALSPQECRELLGTTNVGRVGFASSRGQVILPVNFVFHTGAIYFRTAPTGPLGELADGVQDVAFEIDHHAKLLQSGWSILVAGSARAVDDDELATSGNPPVHPRPWAAGTRDLLVRLSPRTISGRRASTPG